MHPTRRLAVSLVLAATLCLSALGCSSSTKGGASGDFCTKLKTYQNDKNLSAQTNAGDFTRAQAAFDDLAGSAPAEIKTEIGLLRQYVHDVAAAGTDQAKLAKLRTQAQSTELQAASAKLTDYAKNTCKIDVSS